MHEPLMLQSLPWELKAFVYLSASLFIAGVTLLIPKNKLVKICLFLGVEPNHISLGRLPLFWIGAIILFFVSVIWGLLIIVMACCLDVIDGKLAKAMRVLGIIRSYLNKWIGTWLDPLIDKLTLLPFISIVSGLGIIHPLVVFLIVLFDVIGTLLRDPFNVGERIRRRINGIEPLPQNPYRAHFTFRRANKLTETKANPIGKIKSLLQSLGLAFCGPYLFHWIEPNDYPTYWFGVTAFFGFMSVASRHLNIATLQRVLKKLQKSQFEHEDI